MRLIKALDHPDNKKIINILNADGISVMEIAMRLRIDQPIISQRLAVLRDFNIVKCRKEGRNRFYSINEQALQIYIDGISGLTSTIWKTKKGA